MNDSLLIIVNGKYTRSCQEKLNVSFGRLQRAKIPFKVIETQYAGHASKLARDGVRTGYRKFVSAGGDGTSYEIVNGLFPLAKDTPVSLGFLPLGTGNSFIRDFTDQKERYTIEAIIRGRKKKIDIALLENNENSTYFINILSMGFVARVGRFRNRAFSGLGSLGYKAAVLIKAVGQKTFPLDFKCDQEVSHWNKESMFVSFSNSKFTGGNMMIAPHANLEDGKIDITAAYPMKTEELLSAFPEIYKGTHISHQKIKCAQSSFITFQNAQKQPMMIDGEIIEASPKSVRVFPKALEVLL